MGFFDTVKRAMRVGPVTIAPSVDPVDTFLGVLATRRYSPKTIKNYRLDLARLQRHLGRPVATVTSDDLAAYVGQMVAAGMKGSSIRRNQATLRGFFKWAKKAGVVDADPTEVFEAPKMEERLPIHLNADQVDRLLGALGADTIHDLRDAAIVKTLYYTGCRACEVVGLDWERVNLQRREMRVIGKGDRERVVPIPEALVEVLTAWHAYHPSGQGAVFASQAGQRLTYDTLYRTVRTVLRRAGLDGQGFSPHKLRHTYATRLVNRKVSIDKIQKLLGHRRIDTTTIYAHTEIGDDVRQQPDDVL